MDMTRRRLLTLVGAGVGAGACAPLLPRGGGAAAPAKGPTQGREGLDAIAGQIISGGPPPDGIPPIEKPKYLSRAEADKQWKDDAAVDGVVGPDGVARAYPRLITVWHEIVNETFAGQAVSITYCPLTGSCVLFAGTLADGRGTTFGTSGRLYNSNLVMYDRVTRSLWPQLLGVAVEGERKGERLKELPLQLTTTYGRWKRSYPDTLVLSTETGHVRTYGTSPYGDYDTSKDVIFPVRVTDDRFHPKKVVLGVRSGDAALAIPKEEFLKKGLQNFELGGQSFVGIADPELGSLRVFRREGPRGSLRFAASGDGIVDDETRSRWSLEGRATAGPLAGAKLEQVSAFDVQWFAWFAYYPDTQVLQ